MAKAAASVQFGLTLSPLDGTLQPLAEKALEQVSGGGKQQRGRADGGQAMGGVELQRKERSGGIE